MTLSATIVLSWNLVQRFMALLLLIPASILCLPVGLIICVQSPGPLLIRQIRVGKGGILFRMFKLRTMVVDAEEFLPKYLMGDSAAQGEWNTYGRLVNDPRILGKVAKLARRFSIDELPQIINVISGDMNLVGPRPLPPDIVEFMPTSARCKRQEVLPGITGLWQVSGRSDLQLSDIAQLDTLYIESWSILFDLIIIMRTFRAVISAKGAY